MEIQVVRQGHILGSFSEAEFRTALAAGNIEGSDHAWTEELINWVPAPEMLHWLQSREAAAKPAPVVSPAVASPPVATPAPQVPREKPLPAHADAGPVAQPTASRAAEPPTTAAPRPAPAVAAPVRRKWVGVTALVMAGMVVGVLVVDWLRIRFVASSPSETAAVVETESPATTTKATAAPATAPVAVPKPAAVIADSTSVPGPASLTSECDDEDSLLERCRVARRAHVLASIKPSFDCSLARTYAEKTICATPELAEADAYMADDYLSLRRKSSNPSALSEQQSQWRRERDKCRTVDCLERVYRERQAQLMVAFDRSDGPFILRRIPRSIPLVVVGPFDSRHEPLCQGDARAVESDEDRQLAAAGWIPFFGVQSYAGTQLLPAAASLDGQCRPQSISGFVFRQGRVIGQIIGDESVAIPTFRLNDANTVIVEADTYTEDDAECCPSGKTRAVFKLDSLQ